MIDPTHPLFGREFSVVSITQKTNEGDVLVRYRDHLLLRIPIAATTLSAMAATSIVAKLNFAVIVDFLAAAKECEAICSAIQKNSGEAFRKKKKGKSSKTSHQSLKR